MNLTKEAELNALMKEVSFPVSGEVFQAWCAAFTTTAIELIVFSIDGEVLLFPRPKDDPWFSGQVHTAGTVVIPTDTSKEAVLERLIKREIGDPSSITPPELIDWIVFPKGRGATENPRGHELALVHGSILVGEPPKEGTLADPENLPENVIDFHRALVAKGYEWWKRKGLG